MTTADQALRQLKEGNRRFVAGEMIHPDQTADRRAEVAKGQKPFAWSWCWGIKNVRPWRRL